MTTDNWVRILVEAIHSTPTQAVIYLAGGASQAVGWLMSAPGASNTVLEVAMPYSRMSMAHLLGKIPVHFASQQTAEEMALVAYNRAMKLCRPGVPVVGLGFTGSLASSPPKHGIPRFHLSRRTSSGLWTTNVTFSKGLRTREEEDRVSSHFLLKAIAEACRVSATRSSELSESEVCDEIEEIFDENQELQQLIEGKICMKMYHFGSDKYQSNSERKIILSGSFNPLHDGHLKLLDSASSIVGGGFPCFEISAVNADKGSLSIAQIKDRVLQFCKVERPVIVTNQPYFYKKAELFPGSSFVIGADTAERLIDPTYYSGDPHKMLEILSGLKNIGCKFIVGARNVDGVLKVLENFDIPDTLKDMFLPIPVETFRMDISSTEIRRKLGL